MKQTVLNERFIVIEPLVMDKNSHKFSDLTINYSFAETIFGEMLIASTLKGVCYLAFVTKGHEAVFSELADNFPSATFNQCTDVFQQKALAALSMEKGNIETVPLHLKGTEFQLSVWKELLRIPLGEVTSYGKIAATLQKPKACRAVGTAVGDNPVSVLIPCHRVLRTDGTLGGYHWGLERKTLLLNWEKLHAK